MVKGHRHVLYSANKGLTKLKVSLKRVSGIEREGVGGGGGGGEGVSRIIQWTTIVCDCMSKI